eukprot:3451461-Pyramimonas_sp.AAC.1
MPAGTEHTDIGATVASVRLWGLFRNQLVPKTNCCLGNMQVGSPQTSPSKRSYMCTVGIVCN